jgi:hypothetical protein
VDFSDVVLEIDALATITFTSSTGGSMVVTIPDEPGVQQRGNFVVFSATAPSTIAGAVFNVMVTTGEYPFASFGSFSLALNPAGNSYTIDGSGAVLDSSGTCAYRKIGTSIGIVDLTDSRAGAATAHLSFKTATTGTYYAVTGDLDGFQTGVFSMAVPTAPSITQQSTAQVRQLGETAVFTVSAAGTAPLSFQWQKGGSNLADGGRIGGAQSSTLAISNVAEADSGEYRVLVSNGGGQATSQGALLSVVGPPQLAMGQGLTPTGFELTLTSHGGFTYRVEASIDLREWISLNSSPNELP